MQDTRYEIQDTNLFDGRRFAREKEERLRQLVAGMKRKPKMVSFLVGDDPASRLYTKLKKKAAERIGIQYQVSGFRFQVSGKELKEKIGEVSGEYDGVMVQLPLPRELRDETKEILEAIPLEKDVDGLRWGESGMVPATVKAVLSILEEIERVGERDLWTRRFVVVGSRGMVGRSLVYFLKERGVEVVGVDIDTADKDKIIKSGEVLISCVGKPGLIKADGVKDGAVIVDVGISRVEGRVAGDVDKEAYEKARVAVPVPGGVGPVTVVSLLENLVEMVGR